VVAPTFEVGVPVGVSMVTVLTVTRSDEVWVQAPKQKAKGGYLRMRKRRVSIR
jgi:hypothetical protein